MSLITSLCRRLTTRNFLLVGCAIFALYDVYVIIDIISSRLPKLSPPPLSSTSQPPEPTTRPPSTSLSTTPLPPKADAIKQALDLTPTDAVTAGKTEMKNHRAVFTGVAKNNEAQIEPVLKQIVETGALFADYQVLIYDMDSTDKTLDILNEFAKTQGTRWRIIRKQGESLVNLRNSFLAEFRENPLYKDYDLMVVANMNLKYGWDVRGIAHSFSKFAAWDAVSANGVYSPTFGMDMAELHALRPGNSTTLSGGTQLPAVWLTQHSKEFESNPHGYWNWLGVHVNKICFSPSRADPLVPVDSAFGGLAVYKRATIKDCQYSSTQEDSEHVAFHACIRAKNSARIFIDARFLVKVFRFDHSLLV